MLEPLAEELGATSPRRRPDTERARSSGWRAEAGEVDILVANAALPACGLLETFTVEEIDRALDVNLRAPIVLARRCSCRRWSSAGAGISCSSPRSRARRPRPAPRSTTPRSSACAASPQRCAPTCTAAAWASRAIFPGFISDAGMFADADVRAAAGRRHAHAGGRRAGGRQRDRAQPRRGRRGAALTAGRRGVRRPRARARRRRGARRLGSDEIARARGGGPAPPNAERPRRRPAIRTAERCSCSSAWLLVARAAARSERPRQNAAGARPPRRTSAASRSRSLCGA